MAVRFVIGRAGSGKTQRCFRAIVEAMRADPFGPPIYWLVPKQSTFTAERELTCLSGLDAFCRACVVSFEGLGEEVLGDCGGGAMPNVTALGRQMLIGHLLRKNQPRLKHFTSVAHHAGLAAELDTTFAEIERRGKGATDLAQLLTDLQSAAANDVESASLVAKIHDLHLIYDAYRGYLGTDRLDPHGRLTRVLSCIEKCTLLREAIVYVDGFLDFTDYERRVLVALGKVCPLVEITLLCDPASPTLANPHTLPDEMNLFHRTERTYRAIWFALNEAGVAIDETVRLDRVTRFRAPSLAHIEQHFDGDAQSNDSSDGIELIEAPDRRSEVDAAARRIRAMLKEGFRLREIGVLARDANDYVELIDASFREHDIPYFADRRRTAAHHPLLQFARSALAIARHAWPHAAMMTLIKTGLAGASADQADEIENYVLEHRIRGKMWARKEPWLYRRDLTRDEHQSTATSAAPTTAVNDTRNKIVEPLKPFVAALRATKTLPVREIVRHIFTLFESFHIRQTVGQWMSNAVAENRHEERAEHEQVWSELVDLFDQMVDLLGDEPVTLADFQEILESGLERMDLALTPPTVDEVLVGQVDRTRTSELRAVILLGMNESQFPFVQREDNVFSDAERRSLTQRKIDLDPDTTRRLLDERLLAYIAFTRATERLYIVRSLSQPSGRPCAASPYWRRLRELFPQLEPTSIARESAESLDQIGTPRQLVTAMMKWVRSLTPAAAPEGAWAAIYDWLATYPCDDKPIDRMRYRAWKALSYTNTAALSPEVARQMFPSPLNASVSQIETFASCPFRHFLRFGLRLQQRQGDDVTAADLGNIFHQVLNRIVRDLLTKKQDWAELEPADAESIIAAHVTRVGAALRNELMMSSARNKYLLDHIERTLAQVIASQKAIAQRGHFRPAHTNVEFGPGEKQLPPYRVRAKSGELLLHGKIDRVDLIDQAGDLAVIDYRLSGDSLALDRVYHGISLQLLTYLLVLQANGETLAGKPLTPAAAFYLQLLRRLDDVAHPEDATAPDDPAFDLQVKPRGIFDGRSINDLDANLTGGASDVVHAYINKDGAFGRRGSSDVADTSEFAALLHHVENKLGVFAEQMITGEIAIAPYKLGRTTPCPTCEYQCVCRFDSALNRYHKVDSMKREDVLVRVKENQ